MIFLLFIWFVRSARRPQAQALCCKKNVGRGGSPAPWRGRAHGNQVNPCWSFLFFLNLWPYEGLVCSLQGWSPWSNLTSPASGHSLASVTQQRPQGQLSPVRHNSCTLEYPQLPAHLSACPCCTFLSAALCKCFGASGRKCSRTCPTTDLSTSKMPSLGQCSAILLA